MNDDQSILVRCQCGYTMRRRVDARATERWTCYDWYHRTAPEKLNYCPICGVAPSALSTQPVGGRQSIDVAKIEQGLTIKHSIMSIV
jgi:hypothetical protein